MVTDSHDADDLALIQAVYDHEFATVAGALADARVTDALDGEPAGA